MISVEEARERILAALRPTSSEIVALANAWGRVTAVPVLARLTQPPADVSAMDGYALRAADGTLGATLHVIGPLRPAIPSRAASAPARPCACSPAASSRQGADAILLQEDATAAATKSGSTRQSSPVATSVAPARILPPAILWCRLDGA